MQACKCVGNHKRHMIVNDVVQLQLANIHNYLLLKKFDTCRFTRSRVVL